MEQLKTITQLEAKTKPSKTTERSKSEARENAPRSRDEAREILFKERPDIAELFDTIDSIPEKHRGEVVRILADVFSEITPETTDAQLLAKLEATEAQLRQVLK